MTGKMFILVILICWFPDFCHSYHHDVKCEGGLLNVNCPNGHVINIINFNYGRESPRICVYRGRDTETYCDFPSSKLIVSSRCDGRQTCDIPVSNWFFGDPCLGTYKYGEVTYSCKRTTQAMGTTRVACEDEILDIECPFPKKIRITRFLYGRQSSTKCNRRNTNAINCMAPSAQNIVSRRCNGKWRCHIRVNNQLFGDPCHGIFKYGEVTYTCA